MFFVSEDITEFVTGSLFKLPCMEFSSGVSVTVAFFIDPELPLPVEFSA